jgi:hypothetical protein
VLVRRPALLAGALALAVSEAVLTTPSLLRAAVFAGVARPGSALP